MGATAGILGAGLFFVVDVMNGHADAQFQAIDLGSLALSVYVDSLSPLQWTPLYSQENLRLIDSSKNFPNFEAAQ